MYELKNGYNNVYLNISKSLMAYRIKYFKKSIYLWAENYSCMWQFLQFQQFNISSKVLKTERNIRGHS